MKKVDSDVDARILRLTLINGDKISGTVNIKRNMGHDRVSDLLANNQEQFIVLMNAHLNERGSEKPVRHKTLFINKIHIIWASPEDSER